MCRLILGSGIMFLTTAFTFVKVILTFIHKYLKKIDGILLLKYPYLSDKYGDIS